MYKVRLNTPGIQYWVKSFDPGSEKLELTNITADAARLSKTDIPFLEGVINETFECGCIVENAPQEYIVTLLEVYSEYGGEIPQIGDTISIESEEEPTLEAALSVLGNFDSDSGGWYQIDDDTWELYNEGHETGDPLWYQVKIQAPEQHKSTIDMFVAKLRNRAIPGSRNGK